jgi:predicted Zn-ribbon and HTH transcriptional regulator
VEDVAHQEAHRARISDLLQAADVDRLVDLDRSRVLSLHLDTDPTRPENQRPEPAYRIWARQALQTLAEARPKEDRRRILELAERVEERLRGERPRGRGLSVYAADGLWEEFAWPVPVQNRARYGPADVWPVLWLREAYVPYAVLLVHRDHARLLVTHLGEATVVEDEEFHLDTQHWRFTAGKPPSFAKGMGMSSSRGAQRDVYEARVEDHVRRFWSGVAGAAARALEELGVRRLVLGGPQEATAAVAELLPEPARRWVVGAVSVPPLEEWPHLRERVLEVAREDHRRRQAQLVEALLGNAGPAGSVLDLESTLQALARHQVLTVAADRDLRAQVRACTACGFATTTAADRCPSCGGPTEELDATLVLPRMARASRADLVLLADRTLRPHGGVGALLRFS